MTFLALTLIIRLSTTLGAETFTPITSTPSCIDFDRALLSSTQKSAMTAKQIKDYYSEKNSKLADKMRDEVPNSAELFARIIFAEALSTEFENHCKDQGPAVFEAIAWGIMSRLRLQWAKGKRPTMRDSILEPGQYTPTSVRSDFNLLFRCPSQISDPHFSSLHLNANYERYWDWAKQAAMKAKMSASENPFLEASCDSLEGAEKTKCVSNLAWQKKTGFSLVTNFFYPKAALGHLRPQWAKAKDHKLVRGLKIGETVLSESENSCIQFFMHQEPFTPQWRPEVQGGATDAATK